MKKSTSILGLLLVLTGAVPGQAESNLRVMLSAPVVQAGAVMLDRTALEAVYAPRQYAPLWTKTAQVDALLATFKAAGAHALNPADYHISEIESLRAASSDEQKQQLDMTLTDALMRYALDVRMGRVLPRQVKGERFAPYQKIDPVLVVQAASQAPDLGAYLAKLPPQSPVYQGLMQALAKLQAEVAANIVWPVIPEGRKIEPGNNADRVKILRQRLAASGELGGAEANNSTHYDAKLVEAVKAYQQRAGLEPDGVVGRSTLAMLNVPLATRLDQVRANMERLRWQADDLGERYVYVNVPAYQLIAVSKGQVDLNMKVIVGRVKRPTPIFSDQIRMVEFNPTWHVPPTIAREDVLPHLREDPGYALEHKNVRIYQSGVEVDPYTVDWHRADIRHYRLRAEPGPRNPLGTVKFLFPNQFDVYLHDTNERDLFVKDLRAISSGCIRVSDPPALTNWVLGADRPDWTDERRTTILDSLKQTRLTLRTPIPVYISYITAWLDEGGLPVFRDDIYGQDQILIAALNQAQAKPRVLAAALPDAVSGAASPAGAASAVAPDDVVQAAP